MNEREGKPSAAPTPEVSNEGALAVATAIFGEKGAKDFLEYSKPAALAEIAKLSDHVDRLQSAFEKNLISPYSPPRTLSFIAHLSEEQFAYAELLLDTLPAKVVSSLLGRRQIEAIFQRENREEWVRGRVDILKRCRALRHWYGDEMIAFLSLDERKLALVESMQDENDRLLFSTYLVEPSFRDADSFELFEKQVAFWSTHLNTEAKQRLMKEKKDHTRHGLYDVFRGRASWILALDERAGSEQWESILSNPHSLSVLAEAAQASRLAMPLDQETLQDFQSRAELPIRSKEADPALVDEVTEVLEATGLGEALKMVVKEVVVAPDQGSHVTGSYLPFSDTIMLTPPGNIERKRFFLGTVIHESAHAFERLLTGEEDQMAYDRYSTEIFFGEKTRSSDYASSTGQVHGRVSRTHLAESFAEDSRVYLQDESLLNETRRRLVKDVLQRSLPGINLGDLQERIRKTYGTLYGVSVKDVQRDYECDYDISRFVERIGNAQDQEERERDIRDQEREKARKKK